MKRILALILACLLLLGCKGEHTGSLELRLRLPINNDVFSCPEGVGSPSYRIEVQQGSRICSFSQASDTLEISDMALGSVLVKAYGYDDSSKCLYYGEIEGIIGRDKTSKLELPLGFSPGEGSLSLGYEGSRRPSIATATSLETHETRLVGEDPTKLPSGSYAIYIQTDLGPSIGFASIYSGKTTSMCLDCDSVGLQVPETGSVSISSKPSNKDYSSSMSLASSEPCIWLLDGQSKGYGQTSIVPALYDRSPAIVTALLYDGSSWAMDWFSFTSAAESQDLITPSYLDVKSNKIVLKGGEDQYSIDGAQSWISCTGLAEASLPSLALGSRVMVKSLEPYYVCFLGSVENSSLYADFHIRSLSAISPNYDYKSSSLEISAGTDNPVAGEVMLARLGLENLGYGTLPSSLELDVYISKKPCIDSEAIKIREKVTYTKASIEKTMDLAIKAPLPNDLQCGDYFLIVDVDPSLKNKELTHGNNMAFSSVFHVDPFQSAGAFKVYNSWGLKWTDNITKGWYYLPYEQAIKHNMCFYLFKNNAEEAYQPSLKATLVLDGGSMKTASAALVARSSQGLELGRKSLKPLFGSSMSADQAFPGYPISLDASELWDCLEPGCTIDVEISSASSSLPSLRGFSLQARLDGTFTQIASTTVSSSLPVSLSFQELEENKPSSRAVGPSPISLEDFRRLQAEIEPASVLVDGHGTGLLRPSDEDRKLYFTIEPSTVSKAVLPEVVDNSSSKFFPPCGDQGPAGSCVAFSSAYYIMTYEMAREHGWDISSVQWQASSSGGTVSDGTHIMSPAFTYHLINGGRDNGATYADAQDLLSKIGSCTWALMGKEDVYQTSSFSLPSSEAFLQASDYRLSDADPQIRLIRVKDMADIAAICSCLNDGWCLSLSIDAGMLYCSFNSKAVMVGSFNDFGSNHAQTVVGYIQGQAWQDYLAK